MPDEPRADAWPDVDEVVEAFEAAWAESGWAELADFEPAPHHPDRLAILGELVRVDLEFRWGRGRPDRLQQYLERYPELAGAPGLLDAIAFEEYRLRIQAGERPTAEEYRRQFGLDTRGWPPSEGPAPSETPEEVLPPAGSRASAPSADRPRLDPEHAELIRELDRTDPHAAESLAEAVAALPRVGGQFLGFRLRGELGRGAFGRVYLARQGDLADRLVALKVSADVGGETHALARLQHTNIIPIYSVHRRGPLQAVCMPYLGGTTLADTLAALKAQATLPRSGEGLLSTRRGSAPSTAEAPPGESVEPEEDLPPAAPSATPQVERLRGLGYVPAVLWLVERLADGLAHAHDRGILHRDLKPANILFADDGEPLLLDFNLAADTRGRVRASAAMVGGTLPYMAPEQLVAFRDSSVALDPRSDVYALGVILHELLTGSHPFPVRRGSVDAILPEMIADRLGSPPDPRRGNPAISPAVASIVRHALEPDPSRRYQSARELRDDLRRQLDHLPLRHAPEPLGRERLAKWTRRHPRLASSTTIALASSAILLAGAVAFEARTRRYRAVEASESFRRLLDERLEVDALLADPGGNPGQLLDGIEICRRALARYGVPDDPAWSTGPLVRSLPASDRPRLRESLGDMLVRWARALIGRPGPAGSKAHAEALARASTLLDRAEDCFDRGAAPQTWRLARAELARRSGRGEEEVRKLFEEARSAAPRTPREQLQAVLDRVEPAHRRKVLAFLDRAGADDPQDFSNWVILAICYARIGEVEAAARSYGVAIAMAPRLDWPLADRGRLYLDAGDYSAALDDFDRAIALRPNLPQHHVNRALARLGMGDAPGAVEDLTRALALDGVPSRAWFIRARAKQAAGDLEGARLDVEEGLTRTPEDEESYVARGIAKLPGDPAGALADFDAALGLDPRYPIAWQDKASVLSENLGRPEEAIEALGTAIELEPTSTPALAGRGVLLARLGRREAALQDARAALALDDQPLTLYQVGCIFALTSKAHPEDRPEALRLLAEAIRKDPSWLDAVATDPDFDPVRDQPEFRELVKALAVVRGGSAPR